MIWLPQFRPLPRVTRLYFHNFQDPNSKQNHSFKLPDSFFQILEHRWSQNMTSGERERERERAISFEERKTFKERERERERDWRSCYSD